MSSFAPVPLLSNYGVGAPSGIHHWDLRVAALRDRVSEVVDEIEDREGLVMICPRDVSGRGAQIASRLPECDSPVMARIGVVDETSTCRQPPLSANVSPMNQQN